MTDQIWRLRRGNGPLVACAIHNGHHVRPEIQHFLALDDEERLREEDPFTGIWTHVTPTRIIGLRSRFQVDLNRPRGKAVYRTPADAWQLKVWKEDLPDAIINHSLAEYDLFYRTLRELYTELAERHGGFVVYDLHTYNHRREGPEQPAADPKPNPQVNIGTATLANPERFGRLVSRFMHDLAEYDFPTGKLDVRENENFHGGHHPRWAHEKFPGAACVIAIEVKKFFMDEWSGEADMVLVDAIGRALRATIPGVLEEFEQISAGK
ncbi:MAG: N-formylglutamate amidohydrolase [Planctomycetota bacterium]